MKGQNAAWLLNLCLALALCVGQPAWAQTDQSLPTTSPAPHRAIQFDAAWRFHRGGGLGAEEFAFDDSNWRQIDLPHDGSIADLPGRDSPFDPDAISQVSGGFTTGGTGWYRRAFVLPAEFKGNRAVLQFDG